MKRIEIKLGQILKERNMKQGEFAELAEMRPSAVSNLCRGYVDRLSIVHLEKIVNTLNIKDINDLLTLKEEDN